MRLLYFRGLQSAGGPGDFIVLVFSVFFRRLKSTVICLFYFRGLQSAGGPGDFIVLVFFVSPQTKVYGNDDCFVSADFSPRGFLP